MNKSFSFNLAYDTAGEPGQPWGSLAFVDSPIKFNPPAGQRVQLMKFQGTVYAYINGPGGVPETAPAGTAMGLLAGFLTETTQNASGQYVANNQPSPDAAFPVPGILPSNQPQSGCPWFFSGSVTAAVNKETWIVDLDLSSNENAKLDANNVLLVRQAIFLNNTGMPIHMEVSGIIEFQYVPAS